MRAVVDTNVVVSSIFWGGVPRKIIEFWLDGAFNLVVCDEIIKEYEAIFKRISQKYERFESSELLHLIVQNADFYPVVPNLGPECRDKKDQVFLDLAVIANAKYLVSGDKDLLDVGKYPGGTVIKPKPFLDLLA